MHNCPNHEISRIVNTAKIEYKYKPVDFVLSNMRVYFFKQHGVFLYNEKKIYSN